MTTWLPCKGKLRNGHGTRCKNLCTRFRAAVYLLNSVLHVKLLLYRSSFFVVGVAVLIPGGVASHYTSPSSSLDCSNLNTTDNVTLSLVVAPSSTVSAMSTSRLPQSYCSLSIRHPFTYPIPVVRYPYDQNSVSMTLHLISLEEQSNY